MKAPPLYTVGLLSALVLAMARPLPGQVARTRDLDQQRLRIIDDFVSRVHRLALQYEQAGDHQKAKATLNLILKVTPGDKQARAMLEKIQKVELSENRKVVRIQATQGWQSTGVEVFQGRPVAIEAAGTWTFRMNRVVDANGLRIPEELKKFPLGSLIGVIEPSRPRLTRSRAGGRRVPRAKAQPERKRQMPQPFLVGAKTVLNPRATGILYLKIHDADESDNAGSLTVTLSGQIRSR